MKKNNTHTTEKEVFTLSQDGETLTFEGNLLDCKRDWMLESEMYESETFFDWCKNSYPYIDDNGNSPATNNLSPNYKETDKEVNGFTPGEMKWIAWGETITIANFEGDSLYINPKGDYDSGIPSKEDRQLAEYATNCLNEYQRLKAENDEYNIIVEVLKSGKRVLEAENEKLLSQLNDANAMYEAALGMEIIKERKYKKLLRSMLERVNKIENGAFGLKAFDVVQLKKEITAALNQTK